MHREKQWDHMWCSQLATIGVLYGAWPKHGRSCGIHVVLKCREGLPTLGIWEITFTNAPHALLEALGLLTGEQEIS